jgi:hypothetical protein
MAPKLIVVEQGGAYGGAVEARPGMLIGGWFRPEGITSNGKLKPERFISSLYRVTRVSEKSVWVLSLMQYPGHAFPEEILCNNHLCNLPRLSLEEARKWAKKERGTKNWAPLP